MIGLQQISGERIWVELKKILSGNYAGELTSKMLELGIAPYIGLPEDYDIKEFQTVVTRILSKEITLKPITLLTALLRNEKHVLSIIPIFIVLRNISIKLCIIYQSINSLGFQGTDLNGRLKLSAFERDLCLFVILYRNTLGKDVSIV
jgi:hypothetical protein